MNIVDRSEAYLKAGDPKFVSEGDLLIRALVEEIRRLRYGEGPDYSAFVCARE